MEEKERKSYPSGLTDAGRKESPNYAIIDSLNVKTTATSEEHGKEQLGLDVDISENIKPHQWEKLPWRWVVERTFSWPNHSRRLSKDYEISVSSAEAVVIISCFSILCSNAYEYSF